MEQAPQGPLTFIIRVSRDEAGRLSGVVERVRTGEKARVYEIEDIGQVIVRMMDARSRDGGNM